MSHRVLIGAAFTAYRWPRTLLLAAAFAVLSLGARNGTVGLPFIDLRIEVRLVTGMGVAIFVLTPLYTAFPEVEPGLVRERLGRAVRVLAVIAVGTGAFLPAVLASGADVRNEAALLALYLGAGILAVPLIGELAWILPLGLPLPLAWLGSSWGARVTWIVEVLPSFAPAVLVGVAALVYIARGPRLRSG